MESKEILVMCCWTVFDRLQNSFGGEFGVQKRFPKGENTKSWTPIRCLKIPALDLAKEETPDEIIQIENKEDIV